MVKKKLSMNVEKNTLKQWDELAESIGCDRTAMIHNAVKVYELFLTNQLNGDKKESIQEQLNQLKTLIEGFETREFTLTKRDKEIDTNLQSIDIDNIQDFTIISEKLLHLLDGWGSLPEQTIATHLQYPTWIVWTVLKKLKALKKVKVENGEWKLFDK